MCDSVYVNLQTFLHTMCANARQMIFANSYGHKSKLVKSQINYANHATINNTSLAHAYQLDVKSYHKKNTFIRS